MKRIVLIRHGESLWNNENRFTGWTDVDLTSKGTDEAIEAGRLMRENGFCFTQAYTSYLKRAVKSTNLILDQMNLDWIPISKTWRLNERHYGALQGLNKAETAQKLGDELVSGWRRSYSIAPQSMLADDPRSPYLDVRYKDIPKAYLPLAESLKDTVERILPYWNTTILPSLMHHNDILVVAHGNTLRGIIKYLKGISDNDVVSLHVPTAVPYIFEFDNDLYLTKDSFLEK